MRMNRNEYKRLQISRNLTAATKEYERLMALCNEGKDIPFEDIFKFHLRIVELEVQMKELE